MGRPLAEYNNILKQNPKLPGIHYRMGRVYLSGPQTSTSTDEALHEFEAELKIDSTNAAAEFFLAESPEEPVSGTMPFPISRTRPNLIQGSPKHSLPWVCPRIRPNSSPGAVSPLEKYVKMEPSDPAGHYQLSISYAHTGRKDDAAREMAIQQEVARKNPSGPPNGSVPR